MATGFKPTYKELKLGASGPVVLGTFGFKPTYKELKR